MSAADLERSPRAAPVVADRPVLRRGLGIAAVAFGVATLFAGGSVLFGGSMARARAGDVVEFVLVFNFLAGLGYVAGGVAAIRGKRYALVIARFLAVATGLAFVALGAHVALGGEFEARTLIAMTFRSAFWIAQAVILGRVFARERG